ncbi:MAG: HmuY family protein [Sphingobacteriales bacterium]|nr:HmuY family protein [Sphingobacteriales bacterium]
MKRFLQLLFVLLIPALFSCEKEDTAIQLPPSGDLSQAVAVMGSDYDRQVFVSLSSGAITSAPSRSHDLTFEADPAGYRIYLNSAKLMFAGRSGCYDFNLADSTGVNWKIDAEHLQTDSLALGKWWEPLVLSSNGMSEVFIIDRGRIDFSGSDRYRKMQVISHSPTAYTVRHARLDGSADSVCTIQKDPVYALMYFSFSSGGVQLNVAPPRDEWDFVFTRYTHVYFDEPLTSPYRFYPVNGVLQNIWKGNKAVMLELDSVPWYIPFDDFTVSQVPNVNFSADANVVGYDWKYYDFGVGRYFITPDLYYLMLTPDGYYYKFRMLDFYGPNGEKGTVTFQYKRI